MGTAARGEPIDAANGHFHFHTFHRTDMTASSVGHTVGKHGTNKDERKLRKPLIERKRRERINQCLEQLKETVVGAFRLDQSKLEKADILEMTVKHLQNIQKSHFTDPLLGLEAQQRYSSGYIQCIHELHNLLLTCDWVDKNLASRLLNHLLQSLPRSGAEPGAPPVTADSSPSRAPCSPSRADHPSPPSSSAPGQSPHIGGVPEVWRPW